MTTPIQFQEFDEDELACGAADEDGDDVQSLFKWRHHTRVLSQNENMTKEQKNIDEELEGWTQKKEYLLKKLKLAEARGSSDDCARLRTDIADIEKQEQQLIEKKKKIELKRDESGIDIYRKEGSTKSNLLICKEKKFKSLVERWKEQAKYLRQHEQLVQRFGISEDMDESKHLLLDFPELLCEESANYLVLWAINLEVEEKYEKMVKVAHQGLIMEFLLELGNRLETDPRNCILPFFTRLEIKEKHYLTVFNEEVERFKERIRERARLRIEDAIKSVEEEEKHQRLGPGGLDPVEIFNNLPKPMQDAFEKQDEALLEQALSNMRSEDAEHHMDRCIRAGLWVSRDAAAAEETDTGTPVDLPAGFFVTKGGYICKVQQNILNDYERRRDIVVYTEFDKQGRSSLVPGENDFLSEANPSLLATSSRLSQKNIVSLQDVHHIPSVYHTPHQSITQLRSATLNEKLSKSLSKPGRETTNKGEGSARASQIHVIVAPGEVEQEQFGSASSLASRAAAATKKNSLPTNENAPIGEDPVPSNDNNASITENSAVTENSVPENDNVVSNDENGASASDS